MFQVPKGMLQTEAIAKLYLALDDCFKSPRECYKLPKSSPIYHAVLEFQVPKGMLQTQYFLCYPVTENTSFKSPRECYKRKVSIGLYSVFFRFQVPKGMLQTTNRSSKVYIQI